MSREPSTRSITRREPAVRAVGAGDAAFGPAVEMGSSKKAAGDCFRARERAAVAADLVRRLLSGDFSRLGWSFKTRRMRECG
jgi:hypothetical protein